MGLEMVQLILRSAQSDVSWNGDGIETSADKDIVKRMEKHV